MRANRNHFPQAELARYALSPDPDAARWAELREHVESGCEGCGAVVRRFRCLHTDQPLTESIVFAQPTWAIPGRMAAGRRKAAGHGGADAGARARRGVDK